MRYYVSFRSLSAVRGIMLVLVIRWGTQGLGFKAGHLDGAGFGLGLLGYGGGGRV